MKEINYKKLSEVSEVITKGSTPTTYGFSFIDDGIKFIKVENIINGEINLKSLNNFISIEADEFLKRSRLKEDDILISIAGTIGNTAKVKSEHLPANINQAVALIRGYEKHFTPDFLLLLLRSEIFQKTLKRARGVALSNISLTDIRDSVVPLIDLTNQVEIVNIVNGALRLIQKRQETIKLADEFLRSTFLEMFGDPVTNPNGFAKDELNNICDVRDGTHDSPKYISDGYPLITSKNIKNGMIDFSEINFISEIDFKEINKRSKVDDGDIIMPMIGTIGNPVIVKKTREFAIKNVALIKFTKSSISNRYIQKLLESNYFNYIIQKNNRGGTQKFISLGDIRSFPIPIPPLKLQERFDLINDKVEGLINKYKASLTEMENQFNSLMQRAFRGEL